MSIKKSEVVAMFNEAIEGQNKNDLPLLRMTWNDLLDRLEKDGQITRAKADQWVKPSICKDR